jgi:hypothetical protein
MCLSCINPPANSANARAVIARGARCGTVDKLPHVAKVNLVFQCQQLARRGSFYHLPKGELRTVEVLEWD